MLSTFQQFCDPFMNLLLMLKGFLQGQGCWACSRFGAQSLVKDVITGFFIFFEDQFSVGDYVKMVRLKAWLKRLVLRTTKIKSFTGEIYILPNGTITQVVNYSMKNSLAIVDVDDSF